MEGFGFRAGRSRAAGRIDGTEYWVGSHRCTGGTRVEAARRSTDSNASPVQQAVVVVGNGNVCAVHRLLDTPIVRSEAGHRGSARGRDLAVVMLTEDNKGTFGMISRLTGWAEYMKCCRTTKVNEVEELVAKYGTVAMIGDGVERPGDGDAAIRHRHRAIGTDAAIETCAIAPSCPTTSPKLPVINHSRRAPDHPPNIVFAARRPAFSWS
ncbi:MAG: hypothetical protein U0798_06920 [Gemmataceae bacterium]